MLEGRGHADKGSLSWGLQPCLHAGSPGGKGQVPKLLPCSCATPQTRAVQDTNFGVISALSHLLTDTLDTGVIDYLTPDNTVVTDVHQLLPLLIPVGRRYHLADSLRAAPDLPGAQPGSGVPGGARRLLVSGGVHAQEVRRAGRLGSDSGGCVQGAGRRHGQRAGVSWRCPLYCLRQGLAC